MRSVITLWHQVVAVNMLGYFTSAARAVLRVEEIRVIASYSRLSVPIARSSAARANSRVESSVGSGDVASCTINGISVQPSTTASHPCVRNRSITDSKNVAQSGVIAP